VIAGPAGGPVRRPRRQQSRAALTPEARAYVERRPLCFLAAADAQGQPDVSYKGGAPGFVRV
jgi:predicted pyridoxine 5'-phosphate oxidase superfamily flavin-nucleotide-binding protein